jgi:hypothetical protein
MSSRALLATVASATAVGGFLADWNRTHLFNPNWPPHARFHDAQTITLGAMLGTAALVVLRRPGQESAAVSAGLTGAFWLSQGLSFAYPGTGGLEAEFPELVPRIGGFWVNERGAAAGMLALTVAGYRRATR